MSDPGIPSSAPAAASSETSVSDQTPPIRALRLGFVRGVAPSKWARRWAEAVPSVPLELVPLPLSGRPDPREAPLDVVLERVPPGASPRDADPGSNRHALRLYSESVALVVAVHHELAEQQTVDRDTLALIALLWHPDHASDWPSATPWNDPAWAPAHAEAAVELVGSGAGAILLPLPLARHLAGKRTHAVIPVFDDSPLAGTEIWATWSVERDAGDVQQLVGIMRGRTARSQRPGASTGDPQSKTKAAGGKPKKPIAKKPQLPKNSRGAQLAAVTEKREAVKRARAQLKRRGR
ncbi:LysR substrate-binding domain-containing protein [Leucobacter sp. W1153]|uniref:LysR substrate-binding domain-containing protein n=1 Tax=Leucobacter sp. W1153 TaxID=3439064 RepID=UPI003F3FDC85